MRTGPFLYDGAIARATRAQVDQLIVREAAQGREVYDGRWERNLLCDRLGQATTYAYSVRAIIGDEQARAVAERVARILTVHPEWGVIRARLAT